MNRALVVVVMTLGLASHVCAAADDMAMSTDPKLPEAVYKITKEPMHFDERLKPLWLQALARPEAELKCEAARAIAQAHRLGVPGLADTATALLAEFDAPHANVDVRLATAQALIALDARQAAATLMKHALTDPFDLARLIEPALATWNYEPMRGHWLARLADKKTPASSHLLAIQALLTLKLTDALPHLRALAVDAQLAPEVRLEAARALASMQSTGLEDVATKLAAITTPLTLIDRLVAATLLQHHTGKPAQDTLLHLANDPEPAVASLALSRLLEIDPALVEPLRGTLMKSPDAAVRLLAARAFVEHPSPESIPQLAIMLEDDNVHNRIYVQQSMVKLAMRSEFKAPVEEAAMKRLQGNSPRALEQAAYLVGGMHYEPAASRLLTLINDPTPEVGIGAAWALRKLALPSTAQRIFEWVKITTEDSDKWGTPGKAVPKPAVLKATYRKTGHLIEALGLLHYRPASELLSGYISKPAPPSPKPPPKPRYATNIQPELRAAAIWALGQIYAMQPDASVVSALKNRLGDKTDASLVTATAAISLGRMNAKETLPLVKSIYETDGLDVPTRLACGWAMSQITGNTLPPLEVHVTEQAPRIQEWFLEPAGEAPEK